jgi:putative ABC transport system substrate-binding protein
VLGERSGAGAIVAPFGSLAQQHAAKVAKIGWLETGLSDRNSSLGEIFRGRLREFGYHEGKNLIFEYRSAENKLDRLPALADELVRLNVDLIIASASPPTIAARNATKTIPIVFIQLAIDPVAAGIVNSFARPGGNITGLTNAAGALAGKRLELLKQFVPKLSRVAIMWEPKNAGSAQVWKDCQPAARELGMQLHSEEVNSADDFEGAFKSAIQARSGAILVSQMILANTNRSKLVEMAAKARLPAVYFRSEFAEEGGLMSYNADLNDSYRRVASYVDKILKGAKPADLPVEEPTKFELVINRKTVNVLGLKIPQSL